MKFWTNNTNISPAFRTMDVGSLSDFPSPDLLMHYTKVCFDSTYWRLSSHAPKGLSLLYKEVAICHDSVWVSDKICLDCIMLFELASTLTYLTGANLLWSSHLVTCFLSSVYFVPISWLCITAFIFCSKIIALVAGGRDISRSLSLCSSVVSDHFQPQRFTHSLITA